MKDVVRFRRHLETRVELERKKYTFTHTKSILHFLFSLIESRCSVPRSDDTEGEKLG